MFSDTIEELVRDFDEEDLITRFDVDFDAPLRHKLAIGLLQMRDAFDPAPDDDQHAIAVRVGAHWCAMIRADVDYDLLEGLRLMTTSQGDAGRLEPADPFTAYALARWHDGAGKIRYRLGSYSRARISFETARDIARAHRLDWCLPDLVSNFHRAHYEEMRQSAAIDEQQKQLRDLAAELAGEADRLGPAVEAALAELDTGDPENPPVRPRELLRAYSSLLHNSAVALKELRRTEESLTASRRSLSISERLGDEYRKGQSESHQALIDPGRAFELFTRLRTGKWRRGRLIAAQQLARLMDEAAGIEAIEALLQQLAHDSEATGGVGMDIDIYAFSVQVMASMVQNLKDKGQDIAEYEKRLSAQRRTMASSVRGAVAMPAYKRAYAKAVRPSYLDAIRSTLTDSNGPLTDRWELAFRLAEESTGRELLDMLAAAMLPRIDGGRAAEPTLVEPSGPAATPSTGPRRARRAGVRVEENTAQDAALVDELAQRETEFEQQFLRQPLEAAPPDPEIAHRMRMFTVNNPGTCVVRFVTYGRTTPTHVGAFVFRGQTMQFLEVAAYAAVHELVGALPLDCEPSPEQAAQIWETVIEPVWAAVSADELPWHLVLIPTDELFAVPLHVACPAMSTVPLGALVPLSQSVSATAFVVRGRNLLKRQPVDTDDDLAAIILADGIVSGAEIVGTGWDPAHLVVAGCVPDGLGQAWYLPADFRGLAAISDIKPEFFVYAGHGNIHDRFPEFGPYLQMDAGSRLTQYDVALRLRLPRNKLTVLGACLAGQGAHTAGGDVVGFLRSLIAAGAGAVGVPLWSVLDDAMVETVNHLLRASRRAAQRDGTFDVVDTLHKRYAMKAEGITDRADLPDLLQQMPIGLYL